MTKAPKHHRYPVLAANSFQPLPEDYFNAINNDTGMVIFTNLFGISEEVADVYKKIKSVHPDIFVLQDCAHSFFL